MTYNNGCGVCGRTWTNHTKITNKLWWFIHDFYCGGW